MHRDLVASFKSRQLADFFQALIQADPTLLESYQFDPPFPLFHIACHIHPPIALDVIKVLIKHYHHTLQIREDGGRLPLHVACCRTGFLELIKLLVKK